MGLKNPYVFVVLIQILQAGMTLLAKAALNGGMSSFVFNFYRQLAGTVFLLLLSAIFQRRSMTQFTFPVFFKIFALAFLGLTLSINLYGIALLYTPASLASATINCVPVTTFSFAVLLRRETVNVREIAGQFRSINTSIA
ncbi:WAT1-related protein At5g64700-like [Eucalyptus grandis]|uniref:WAT1-related protein At5g64700-like n=1 Tax=Eucalyptus grandis TaxID=71139 RepID=UPI00192F081D|nr:WAT1-related protein At5g64700-like [Eucalyptus grandis]